MGFGGIGDRQLNVYTTPTRLPLLQCGEGTGGSARRQKSTLAAQRQQEVSDPLRVLWAGAFSVHEGLPLFGLEGDRE